MKKTNKKDMKCCSSHGNGCGGCAYGLGLVGALVYNISVATTFWAVVLGILKAFVWPAFIVFEVMKFLGM